jgi:hypothetical protein
MAFRVTGLLPVVKFTISLSQLGDLDAKLLAIPANPIPIPPQHASTGRLTFVGKTEKYAVTIEAHPNPPEYTDDAPLILVAAFDSAQMRDTTKPARILLVRSASADEIAIRGATDPTSYAHARLARLCSPASRR